MLRYEEMQPTISLFETYADFVRGGNYETVAIIVFAMIVVWGVFDTIKTYNAKDMNDGIAQDLLVVGIVAIAGGLAWPIVVPLVCVAAIVGAVYQIARKFNVKK